MKKSVFKKTAVYILVSIVLAFVVAMALLIYLPAFTAYADGETESVTTVAIRIAPSDLKNNAYAGKSNIAVKDFETDEILFYLPESYFVTGVEYRKIAKFEFEYYAFSYAGLDTSKWYIDYDASLNPSTVTFEDENPFPDVRLDLVENGVAVIDDTAITSDYTIKFIGFDETGSKFFVSATKDAVTKYGMVDKIAFVNSDIPYQSRAQAEREELLKAIATTPKAGDIVPTTSRTLRIILIVGICIPAVLVVLLLFKPSKDSRRKSVARERSRDEFDYDDARTYRRNRRDDRDDRDRDYRDDRRYPDDRDYRDRRDERDYRDDRRYDDRPRDDRRY